MPRQKPTGKPTAAASPRRPSEPATLWAPPTPLLTPPAWEAEPRWEIPPEIQAELDALKAKWKVSREIGQAPTREPGDEAPF